MADKNETEETLQVEDDLPIEPPPKNESEGWKQSTYKAREKLAKHKAQSAREVLKRDKEIQRLRSRILHDRVSAGLIKAGVGEGLAGRLARFDEHGLELDESLHVDSGRLEEYAKEVASDLGIKVGEEATENGSTETKTESTNQQTPSQKQSAGQAMASPQQMAAAFAQMNPAFVLGGFPSQPKEKTDWTIDDVPDLYQAELKAQG